MRLRAKANRVPSGVVALGFVSLFMDVSSEMTHAVLPLFLVGALGATVSFVGLVEGVAEATAGIAKMVSGAVSDRLGGRWGLRGRVRWLFAALLAEGLALMLFSRMPTVALAIPAMLVFGLFMKMAEGATYAVVPFVNRRALGSVAGLVGAGGNAGAVAAGFLMKDTASWPAALLVLGGLVTLTSFVALSVRFSPEAEAEAALEFSEAKAQADSLRRPRPAAVLEPQPA